MMKSSRYWLRDALRILRLKIFSQPAEARNAGKAFYLQTSLYWRWLLLRAPALLGGPGVVGIGLLIACSAFYFSTIQQAQKQLSAVQENVLLLQEQVQRAGQGTNAVQHGSEEQIIQFYRSFPRDKDLPQWMEKIFASAQSHGIELEQGEYKVTRDENGAVVRFQMVFPVKADYPRIRKYLSSLKAGIPTISLQQVQFKRQKVGDAAVEANIKLVLYLLEHKS